MKVGVLAAVGLALLAGCSSAAAPAPAPAPGPNPAANTTDAAFVLPMLTHHRRALEVGAVLAERGSDPRARAFGQRILTEQTPEEQRLQSWVGALGLTPGPTDVAMADGYVDDASLARLRTEPASAVERDALLLSARSEEGAAQMSRVELGAGVYPPARELATSISTAPTGEIPELRMLAAALPA